MAWARLCPRLDESAGKVHSRQFLRLRSRRGVNKAIVAVAASILTAVYCMIRDHAPYRDLGFNYFQDSNPDRLVRRSVARLQQLGYVVTLTRGAA